jgi:Ca2+-binding RTX toxin-like protein
MRTLGMMVTSLLLATLAFTTASIERVGATENDVPYCEGYLATIWEEEEADDDSDGAYLVGTSSRDVIVGTDGPDVIKGNGGNDIICGLDGDDKINGNSGNDTIVAGVGNDKSYGDSGNDTIWGAFSFGSQIRSFEENGEGPPWDDLILGGSGNDVLIDFFGWNDMDGGSGNDTLFGRGWLKGNSNNDTVSSNIFFFFFWYFDGPRSEGLCNFDVDDGSTLEGGSGNDLLVGSCLDNILNGNSGNDQLYGEGGDDTYNGGTGRDVCQEEGTSCEVID